jgi:dipeptidyl aminopeptidase/acylaminoacyl peptidase
MLRRIVSLGLAVGAIAVCGGRALSGQSAPTWSTPPRAIVDILDAAPLPAALVSPSRDHVVLVERRSLGTLRELAQPMLRLAGERINPRNYAPHRSTNIVGFSTVALADGATRRVGLDANETARPIGFSHDGRLFAFARQGEDRVTLWVVEVATGQARAVTDAPLNTALARAQEPCEWAHDGLSLLCTFAVESPSRVPAPPAVPSGPSVQENTGEATPAPTYQDLLNDDHDERVFEYLTTSQLAWVDLASGRRTPVGTPGIYELAAPSPDGSHILVSRLKRPFSRTVPHDDFAKDIQVWSRTGALVRTIADLPVADNVPIGGVATGPRAPRWNRAAPATVVWVEALDGGDTRKPAPERDRVLGLHAPFTGAPREIARTTSRFRSVEWTDTGVALVTDYDRRTRMTRTLVVDDEGAQPRLLWERNADDAYTNPGTPVTRPGRGTVAQQGGRIFLRGDGSSPSGDRPFLDALDLATGRSERRFQTSDGTYEQTLAVLSDDGSSVLTRYETARDAPNYYVRNLSTGERRALTSYADPAPALAGVRKERLTYTRADGVELSATLMLPPGHQPGQKHPLLVWAYPREFGDSSTAGQVRGSLHRFTTISGASHLLLLTQGYAILDDPTMPIVGSGDTANDSYVEQLVASAQAAVDKVAALGVADRDRIGVGGHSYGAFMTANLLAHSDLFRAGIARSGAYNRTLTPFGFQNEQRTFWEVPDIYARMSPFWNAHRIKEPILLIHGEADDNTGTYPVQSERFYAALKGHGATVRYVTLPHEAHGYVARESVLHTVHEMLAWMDKYVKNAGPRPTSTSEQR